MTTLLELEGVAQSFGELRVLDGVSMSIEAGESVALIGPNGAGKTTLMRIAQGLLVPDAGSVHLGQDAVHSLEQREIARRVSVVRQAAPQVFDFTALEVVLMGFHARTSRFSLPSEQQRRAALDAMAAMDVDGLAERSASVLSGGELQRVLMARTLVSDCPLWLLDEPTSNLDLRYQIQLLERIGAHVAGGGATLAILHDLSLAHRFFDRAVVLCDARVAADGVVDDVLTEDLLSDVFDVELRLGEVAGEPCWAATGW
ncbi:MAG: ABC transporter ATP-binding protein [Myxococcota bacterium]